MLYEAAKEGNVATLLEILRQDPLILDRLITECVAETPLHVASMLGHLDFVKEILRQKPELVMALDLRRSSALHLASAKGYVEVVKELLHAGPEMCLARDAEGRNPLHLAAMKGHVIVLGELVQVNSQAVRDKAGFGESILHLCVKHKQLKALELLVCVFDDYQFVNVKDDYGMTILHRAVVEKNMEIITFLIATTRIVVNALTTNGFTALDILKQSGRDVRDFEIGESLRGAGGTITTRDVRDFEIGESLRGTITTTLDVPILTESRTGVTRTSDKLVKQPTSTYVKVEKENKQGNWLIKKREGLMVVASLIATMAFQAALTPPAGLWQEDTPDHRAGSSIMAEKYTQLYSVYLSSNTLGFISSLSIILLLVTGLPFARKFFMWLLIVIMWIAITAMALTYIIAILVSTTYQHKDRTYSFHIFGGHLEGYMPGGTITYVLVLATAAWIGLTTLLLLLHAITQLVKLCRWIGSMTILLLKHTVKLLVKLYRITKGEPSV